MKAAKRRSDNGTRARPPGRPRDPRTDGTIVAAARALLAQGGFDALNFEAIAQLTGVTRPTIYRRWPSKVHLANEIANGSGRGLPDVIAIGGLRAQIRALVEQLYEQYSAREIGAATVGLILAYQADPALREELHTPLEMAARAELRTIIDKGRASGVVRPEANADAIFDLLVGAVMFRIMFSSLPAPRELIEQITDIVAAGTAAD